MRKVIIILAALTFTALAYWGYTRLSGSATLEPPTTHSGRRLELPESAEDAQRIGGTLIHEIEQSYYITRDPVTRQVTRVFGFSRLNNPGSRSARWEVEKPYIIFYESAYQCRIDADRGLIQTEPVGASVTPRDGRLEGNVVIRLKPQPGSRMAETTILMDDVLFSSERTEFSTDGPVQVVSSQVELSGRGLVLLVSALDGQVEYLHILDLESLRIRDFVQADFASAGGLTPSASEAAAQESSDPGATALTAQTEMQDSAFAAETPADTERRRLYQCVIEDNVLIRYGDQLVVAGADQVSIQNILLSRRDTEASPPEAGAVPQDGAEIAAAVASQAPTPQTTSDAMPARDDSRDVIVTCNGGIVIRPMPAEQGDDASNPMRVSVEMNGAPLRIEQVDPHMPDRTLPLAHCGLLQYDMATDVLKLFSDAWHGDIQLGGGSEGRIETQGPVVWDRRANHARIVGPGTVFFDGEQTPAADAGKIVFDGLMELFFADAPTQTAALHLTAASLTGGMSARFSDGRTLMTAAESAYLAFGPQNALTSARLEGQVEFENADGDVPSRAAAHTAVFHFDDNRQLARADLDGDVRFASRSGRLHTDQAIIAFAPDAAGSVQAAHFDAPRATVLETLETASEQPPARFEARSISYDLQTGSGRAVGPVRFVFYRPAEPGDGLLTDFWPLEITADGDAEFIAGDTRQIETIVFNRRVNGVQTRQYAAYTETNAFRADTMHVRIGRSAQDVLDIQSVTLRDGDVFAESIRTHETLKLAHTRLNCREIVYDRQNDRLRATGPGQIELDNSKAEPTASSGGLDLRGPSFARIEGFDRIEWNAADRRIVADGNADVLRLAYIPLENGAPAKLIRAAAGRVEMHLDDAADGKAHLVKLAARDRVFFEEQGKHILEGYTLVYDAEADGWLTITGTDDRPCMADGARVPYIHYNLNTGQLETRLATIPGAVTIPR